MKKKLLTWSLGIAAGIVLIFGCTPFTFGNAFVWFWRKYAMEASLGGYIRMFLPLLIAVPAFFIVCGKMRKSRENRPVRTCSWMLMPFFIAFLIFFALLVQCAPNGFVTHPLAVFSVKSQGVLCPSIASAPFARENLAEESVEREVAIVSSSSRNFDVVRTWSSGRKAFSKMTFKISSWIGQIMSYFIEREMKCDLQAVLLCVSGGFAPEEKDLFAPLGFLFLSSLVIPLFSFLLLLAALRLYGRPVAVTTNSVMNAMQATFVLTLPVILFTGRAEAVHFCLAAAVIYFIVCAFRANAGFCKAGYCALAGLLNAVAISFDIIFLLFIPFTALLFFCRKDWRKGRVPMVLYCTGALVFFVAVWAYADVNLFAETAKQFTLAYQGTLYPDSVKFAFLQIPYNLLSIIVFATPMACLTAFSSRHLFVKKYAGFSIHDNLFAWATAALVLVAVAVPYIFGVTGAATLAVIPVLLVLSVKNILEAKQEMPDIPFKTALFAQVVLIAAIHAFFHIPFVY